MSHSGGSGEQPNRPTLRIDIEPSAQAPAVARAAIRGFCHGCKMSASAEATAVLLVSEVVTNAVVHPEVPVPSAISLYVRLDSDVIRVEVADPGSGFAPAPRDPARAHGGYGLFLLDKQAARWGVQPTPRATVWFEVDAGACSAE